MQRQEELVRNIEIIANHLDLDFYKSLEALDKDLVTTIVRYHQSGSNIIEFDCKLPEIIITIKCEQSDFSLDAESMLNLLMTYYVNPLVKLQLKFYLKEPISGITKELFQLDENGNFCENNIQKLTEFVKTTRNQLIGTIFKEICEQIDIDVFKMEYDDDKLILETMGRFDQLYQYNDNKHLVDKIFKHFIIDLIKNKKENLIDIFPGRDRLLRCLNDLEKRTHLLFMRSSFTHIHVFSSLLNLIAKENIQLIDRDNDNNTIFNKCKNKPLFLAALEKAGFNPPKCNLTRHAKIKICGDENNRDIFLDYYEFYLDKKFPQRVAEILANISIFLTSKEMLNIVLPYLENEIKNAWNFENNQRKNEDQLILIKPEKEFKYYYMMGLKWPFPRHDIIHQKTNNLLGKLLLYNEQNRKINLDQPQLAGRRPVSTFMGLVPPGIANKMMLEGKCLFNDESRQAAASHHSKEMHRLIFCLIMYAVEMGILDIGKTEFTELIAILLIMAEEGLDDPKYAWNYLLDLIHVSHDHPLRKFSDQNINERMLGLSPQSLHSYLLMSEEYPYLWNCLFLKYSKDLYKINELEKKSGIRINLSEDLNKANIYDFCKIDPNNWTINDTIYCISRFPTIPLYHPVTVYTHLKALLVKWNHIPPDQLAFISYTEFVDKFANELKAILHPLLAERLLIDAIMVPINNIDVLVKDQDNNPIYRYTELKGVIVNKLNHYKGWHEYKAFRKENEKNEFPSFFQEKKSISERQLIEMPIQEPSTNNPLLLKVRHKIKF